MSELSFDPEAEVDIDPDEGTYGLPFGPSSQREANDSVGHFAQLLSGLPAVAGSGGAGPSSGAFAIGGLGAGGGSAPVLQGAPQGHVSNMPDYSAHAMGESIHSRAPLFSLDPNCTSGWQSWTRANTFFVPARAMCFFIPIDLFANGAESIGHFRTPKLNSSRAVGIAALLGLLTASRAKGFPSGSHVEKASAAAGEGDDGAEDVEKKVREVREYLFFEDDDSTTPKPMFVYGYEEIYGLDRTTKVGVRIWIFVFDKKHSESELLSQLLREGDKAFNSARKSGMQNAMRRDNLVKEATKAVKLLGGPLGQAKVEGSAGNQYLRITNESHMFNFLKKYYAGDGYGKHLGRPLLNFADLPPGMLNMRLEKDPMLSGRTPLDPAYLFNAKRPNVLGAGTVDMEGNLIDVHPDQLNLQNYFNPHTDAFLGGPEWNRSQNNGLFVQTDPRNVNLFDCKLPRALWSQASPAECLQKLYKTVHNIPFEVGSAELIGSYMTAMSGARKEDSMASEMPDITRAFDTENEAGYGAGAAFYGGYDAEQNCPVIEPRQALKEIQLSTAKQNDELIAPWVLQQQRELNDLERAVRRENGGKLLRAPLSHPAFAEVNAKRAAFNKEHCELRHELFNLHAERMWRAFTSSSDRETIAAGYKAMFDGMQAELKNVKDGSLNLAFAEDVACTDSSRSTWGNLYRWLEEFFKRDGFVDGRDSHLMFQLLFWAFEPYGDTRFIMFLVGGKGTGKSIRTEVLQAMLPPGVAESAGPSSAKAGALPLSPFSRLFFCPSRTDRPFAPAAARNAMRRHARQPGREQRLRALLRRDAARDDVAGRQPPRVHQGVRHQGQLQIHQGARSPAPRRLQGAADRRLPHAPLRGHVHLHKHGPGLHRRRPGALRRENRPHRPLDRVSRPAAGPDGPHHGRAETAPRRPLGAAPRAHLPPPVLRHGLLQTARPGPALLRPRPGLL